MSRSQAEALLDIEQAENRRIAGYRRLVRQAILFVLALVLVRLGWGWEAGRRLQAEIDRIHAAGEPILLSDFPLPAVINARENAAYYYGQAAGSIRAIDNDALSWVTTIVEPTSCKLYAREIEKSVAGNSTALRLLRRAGRCPQVDWGFRFTSPLVSTTWSLSDLHQGLRGLLVLATHLRANQGNHAEAIETVLDMEYMARHLARQPSSNLLPAIGGMGLSSSAGLTLEAITPGLLVTDTKLSGDETASPVARDRVEQLIELLLDDSAMIEGWRKGLCGERATAMDYADLLSQGRASGTRLLFGVSGSFGDRMLGWALKPIFQLDVIRMIKEATAYLEAGTRSEYASPVVGGGLAPDLSLTNYHTWEIAHRLHFKLGPSYHRALQLHFRSIAERRLAATALAIRLYELDHGQRPDLLERLVPDYLRAVPDDPFSSEGRKLGYNPAGAKPILYSVNIDGRDDGGEYVVSATGHFIDRERKDFPFFLNGDRPAPPLPQRLCPEPSEEAKDHQGQKRGRKGNADQREQDRQQP